MPRLGLSMYALRRVDESVAEQIHRVAAIGYEGILFQHGCHQDMDFKAVAEAIEETGIEPWGVHVGRSVVQTGLEEIVEAYEPLGVSRAIIHTSDENWTNVRANTLLRQIRERSNELEAAGWDMLIHPNHTELLPIHTWPPARWVPWLGVAERLKRNDMFEGSSMLGWLALNESRFSKGFNLLNDWYYHWRGRDRDNTIEDLAGTMFERYLEVIPEYARWEIDVAFFPVRGYDPIAILETYGEDIEQLHLKDISVEEYPPGRWPPFREVGEGDIDIEGVLATACDQDIETILFEHDPPEGKDPWAVVEGGYETSKPILERAIEQQTRGESG